MLGRKQELNLQIQQIIDGCLLVFTFWLSHVAWFLLKMSVAPNEAIPPFSEFAWVLIVLMPFGPIILELQGFYSHILQKTAVKSLWQILRGGMLIMLIITACSFFFRLGFGSRMVVIIFPILATFALLLRERLTLWNLRARGKADQLKEPVLFVGRLEDIHQLRASLTPDQFVEMDIVGELDIETTDIATLIETLHKRSVSRVIFAAEHSQLNRIQQAILACEIEGVEAWLVADFIRTTIARPDFDMLGSRPMIVFRTTPAISWALMIKSAIDLVGALVLMVILSPLYLIATLGIKLTSPGPILFAQQRAGKHGRPFTMYKFRSMHTDAEMRRAELEAFNEMSGPVFKIEKDPRITPFGRWLRKTSIDELPQLWNVLRGEMSLVGPRPLPIYEVEKFSNTSQRRRLSVKPGLTCLWQVSGRNKVQDFQDWVRLDLEYIDRWSLLLDLQILLRTIPAVLFGLGAK